MVKRRGLCRLHRSDSRPTGRVANTGRHNLDVGIMTLPAHLVHDLADRGALGPLQEGDHLGRLAALARPGGIPRLGGFLARRRLLGGGGLLGRLTLHRRALGGLCATVGLLAALLANQKRSRS